MTRIDRKRMPFAMLAAIALALVALPALQAGAKVSKICKPGLYLFEGPWSAKAPNHLAAQKLAIADWESAVSSALGQPWSHWAIAKHQHIFCDPNPQWTSGPLACHARAQPCRQDMQPSASKFPPPRAPSRFTFPQPGAREPIGIRRPPQFTGRPRFSAAPIMRRRLR